MRKESFAPVVGRRTASLRVVRSRKFKLGTTTNVATSRAVRLPRQFVPPAMLFLTLVFQLWIRIELIETSYRREEVRRHAVNKDAEVRMMRSDLAIRTRPGALLPRAEDELEMVLPSARAVRRIGRQES